MLQRSHRFFDRLLNVLNEQFERLEVAKWIVRFVSTNCIVILEYPVGILAAMMEILTWINRHTYGRLERLVLGYFSFHSILYASVDIIVSL